LIALIRDGEEDVFFTSIDRSVHYTTPGIYECRFVCNKWAIIKTRPHKTVANAKETVLSTVSTVDEDITLSDLL
jgi:hypothetical protein